jgi:hypothetical protein
MSITGGGSVSLIALAYEIGYALIRVRQRFLVGQKDNAEVPGAGLLPEARAVHHHDMFLKNKFLHEHRVVLGNIQPGISVESSTRRDATHSRSRVAPTDRQITPRTKLTANLNEMILRALERGLDGVLFRMICA